jgi:FAD/FMN-containing dehydrogenase
MLSSTVLSALKLALGDDRVFTDDLTLELYSSDETPRQVKPRAVVFPASHEHVVELARIAHAHRIPLVANA